MEQAILDYMDENAKQIDVLNLYHLTKETIYYALHFKKKNPAGKIYLKMDVYNQMLEEGITYSKKRLFNSYHKQKEKRFLNLVDVVSAENPVSLNLLKEKYPVLKDKAILVTNGINDRFIRGHYPEVKDFDSKENIILSVGRIGAKEKNYEMLVRSFCMSRGTDWKLVLVGPISNNFDSFVEELVQEYPDKKGLIELVGSIEDRVELYSYYNRSKIFALTSPFESFGIAFVEAMYFGNYIVGTNGMSSFDFISDHRKLGSAVEVNDNEALCETLNNLMSDDSKLRKVHKQAQQQVEKHFYWSNIVVGLDEALNR